jgi:hypothetical protein
VVLCPYFCGCWIAAEDEDEDEDEPLLLLLLLLLLLSGMMVMMTTMVSPEFLLFLPWSLAAGAAKTSAMEWRDDGGLGDCGCGCCCGCCCRP